MADTEWIFPQEIDVPAALVELTGSALLARVLVQRGLADPRSARAFLNPDAYGPAQAEELPDLEIAVRRLMLAIKQGEPIIVWGDFDVDGQTATTLLVQALGAIGGKVTYYIPNRARESHGVNLPGLARLVEQGARVVLTCDTGIGAVEAAAYARQQRVDFLVTDHHDLPEKLPQAMALINPKFLADGHPLSTLPGVGVAYKLAEALLEQAGRPEAARLLLDLVALGVVADVAMQTGDTRYLLQRGLLALRETRRLGLLNLYELAGLQASRLTEEHIGFSIGPRLNALGRLDDANQAVELLTTSDSGRARLLATQIEGLNAQRKLQTDQVFQGVLEQIERTPQLLQHHVLVFANPAWPAGVIGIVASRLVERFHKPVILFAAEPGGQARGSARSVAGLNITAAIAVQREMLYGFGGHPMAAGLALDTERLAEFQRAIDRTVSALLPEFETQPRLALDGRLGLEALTPELVRDLERLAPFGPGNPALIFASPPLVVKSAAPVGRGAEHLQVTVADEMGREVRVMWWQGAGWDLPQGRFELAYSARSSNYLGQPGVQITWIDARQVADLSLQEVSSQAQKPRQRRIHDYRAVTDPQRALAETSIAHSGGLQDAQVWSEGLVENPPGARTRLQLDRGGTLVVFSIPPGQAELRNAIQRTEAEDIFLFAAGAAADSPELFLEQLGGLVKYTLRTRAGQTSLTALAGALGQREESVAAGLDWLQARGQIRWQGSEGGHMLLEAASNQTEQQQPAGSTAAFGRLKRLLEETRAFRNYYRQAAAETLTDL